MCFELDEKELEKQAQELKLEMKKRQEMQSLIKRAWQKQMAEEVDLK